MEPPKPEESIAAYKKALEINPKERAGRPGPGLVLLRTRRTGTRPIAAFNKAIQIDPKTAGEANNGDGWSYFFKKELPKAKEFMEKAKAAGRAGSRASRPTSSAGRRSMASPATGDDAGRGRPGGARRVRPPTKGPSQDRGHNDGLRSGSAGERCRALTDLPGAWARTTRWRTSSVPCATTRASRSASAP